MEANIESAERRRFMAHIANDFSGQQGMMNRDRVKALVVFQLTRHKKLNAQLFPIHVKDQGDGFASARFRALVTGGPGLIPDSGQVFNFETRWRLQDDEWMLVAADWTPIPLEEAL